MKSCIAEEHVREARELIKTLRQEITEANPNKAQKQEIIDGLEALLQKSIEKDITVEETVTAVEKKFPNMCSTRTEALLNSIKNDAKSTSLIGPS